MACGGYRRATGASLRHRVAMAKDVHCGGSAKTASYNASVTSISLACLGGFRRDDTVGVRQRFEGALRRVVSEAAMSL